MNSKLGSTATILLGCLTTLGSSQAIAQQPKAMPPPGEAPIKVSVDSVLIPAVVRDSQGHAVGNLKKEDFQLFDQGKLQDISGFSIQVRSLPAGNRPPGGAAPDATHPVAGAQRFIVLLFDDLHLSAADLGQVQKAASKMLESAFGDSDFADVLSFSGTNSGLTRDRAKLQDTILKLHVHELYRRSAQECPDIDFYLADQIINKNDRDAFESAVRDTMTCDHLQPNMRSMAEGLVHSSASRSLSIGEQDVRLALLTVKEVVSKMAGLPGQRSLILVSPGFYTVTFEAMALKSQILDLAARSNVTISALDARGLYTTNPDVSQSGDTTTYALMRSLSSQRQRDSMAMNEDVMAEFAEGTGGTFIHNTNDLQGGFERLAAAPEYLYLLELSLQNVKPDGAYHKLKVKLNQEGLKLQARRGYYAPKPASDKK